MLTELAGLLEHSDLDLADASTVLVVFLDQPCQFDRACEPARTPTHEDHVHRDRFFIRLIGDDETVAREGRLSIE